MCIRDRYYIGEDGKMVRNQYVDRFFVSEDGSWNGRFEPPNWLMHGIWKKNGNTWTYQYNNITQFLDFSQIRSISRLGYDVYSEKTPPEQSEESYRLAVENGFTILSVSYTHLIRQSIYETAGNFCISDNGKKGW